MTHLSKLKFSDKQRSQVKMTVEERLRHKLIDRLKEQKELAEADLNGKALVRTRYKMIKDEETGETKRVEVPRLLRRWWWKDETDAVLLELRYGNKPIEPTFCFVSMGERRRRANKEQRGGEDKAALHFISP